MQTFNLTLIYGFDCVRLCSWQIAARSEGVILKRQGQRNDHSLDPRQPTGQRHTAFGFQRAAYSVTKSTLRAEDRIKAHFLGVHALTQQGERRANSWAGYSTDEQRGCNAAG